MEVTRDNYKGCRQVFEKELQGAWSLRHDINFDSIWDRTSPCMGSIGRSVPLKQERVNKLLPALSLSQHAILRMAQRNISLADVKYVLEHGESVHRTGVTIYMLRKRDIPQNDRKESGIMRLEGTIVLTGSSQGGNMEVITTYRNKAAFRTLRSKKKYDHRKRYLAKRDFPPDQS